MEHPRITAPNAPTSERVVNGINQYLAAWIDVVETQHAVGDVAESDAGAGIGKPRAPPQPPSQRRAAGIGGVLELKAGGELPALET
ncbi:hypothetical protein X736_01220 [Mesorhizobium sp. L2C089B000]|nr:hypothetical protein X736_01220 [Mesorhizobium sp. L2C089B000]